MEFILLILLTYIIILIWKKRCCIKEKIDKISKCPCAKHRLEMEAVLGEAFEAQASNLVGDTEVYQGLDIKKPSIVMSRNSENQKIIKVSIPVPPDCSCGKCDCDDRSPTLNRETYSVLPFDMKL